MKRRAGVTCTVLNSLRIRVFLIKRFLPIVRAILFTGSVAVLSACGGGGGGGEASTTPPLNIISEDNQAASAAVGEAGGTVVATASDGTTYTLTIPAGALAGQETITIVPVTAVGGLPLRGGLVAAVRFAPDGLELLKPATLTIELPQQPAATGLVGFGFQGSGEGFHLDLVEIQGSRLVFSVTHFSGVGTGIALTGDLQQILSRPPNDPEFQALNEIVSLFAQGETDPTLYKFHLSEWYDARVVLLSVDFGVRQGLKEYGVLGTNPLSGDDDPDEILLRRALRGYVSWLRMIDLVSARLGVDIRTVEFVGTLQQSIDESVPLAQLDFQFAITRANRRCLGELALGRVDTALARADTALLWQGVAQALGLATQTFSLDLTSVLSGLCIKVEITDVNFPAVIQAGQTATLSFRAPVVPSSYTRPVAVTIAASGVAAPVPGGQTDASAHFSVPVQPIGASGLVLDVKACLDEPAFPRLSRLCGRTLIQRGPPDTTPPTVLSTGPANGAAGVPITAAPFATFSEAMDSTTITGTTFTLFNSTGGGIVAATVTLSAGGTTATLTPSSSLAPSTLYRATITIGARDLSGNRLASDFTWSFTTGTGSSIAILGGYDGAQISEIVGTTPASTISRWVLIGSIENNSFVLQRKLFLGGGVEGCAENTCTPDFSLSGGTIQATGPKGSTVSGSVVGGQLHFVYDRPCEFDPGLTCRETFDGARVTVQVTPASLDFGTVTAGGTSAPKTVTVANTSVLPVRVVLSVSFAYTIQDTNCLSSNPFAGPGSFFQASSASFGVEAGSACNFTVQFAPPNQGSRSGTLNIGSGEAAVPASPLPLSGVGN